MVTCDNVFEEGCEGDFVQYKEAAVWGGGKAFVIGQGGGRAIRQCARITLRRIGGGKTVGPKVLYDKR